MSLEPSPLSGDVWFEDADFWYSKIQVFYSQGGADLAAVSPVTANDNSGRGQYHFGLLKKPTGDGLTDITKQGFQETGISEGIVFGGIYQEDSAAGCISLSNHN